MNAPGPNHLQVVLSRIALGIYVLLFFLEFVLNILKLNLPLAILTGCLTVLGLILATFQAFPQFLQWVNFGGLLALLSGRVVFILLCVLLVFSGTLNILLWVTRVAPPQDGHSRFMPSPNPSASPTMLVPGFDGGTPSVEERKANPYPAYLTGYGTIALDDPLQNNRSGAWEEYPPDSYGGSCVFINGAYHVFQTQGITYCKGNGTSFRNFAFEVQMTILQGDCGGILFRGDTSNRVHPNFFYQFQVCQDGTYQVLEGYEKPLTTSSNHVIHRGLKQSNLIAVVASGNMISVYVNQQVIDYGPGDDHITHGFIGVGAIDKKNSTEVLYNHARVWTA